ncbi:Virulence sensor protein BvgS precursor [Clostridium liquoris]|jgi:polar amino acid transport system substrate-binding protein|uniref:histidine kinase n=1 Tax=Clostridium liquoris TaxID=1289519 RepID=A0A2T0B051_9CLOT|nr:transporter substrate-binding domain-containing protein [Clostridium liquoris]PRR76881.1 Virulence sensor protein BvgS precursor [Clostridium liquoris]
MKKKPKWIIIFILLGVVVLAGISWRNYKNYSNNKDKQPVLKVAGDINFPPFEYMDENGVYTGFNVDIIRAISIVSGVDVQFYPMKWEEACEKLKAGEIDLIQGMKYTEDREKYYDFSKGYLQNTQLIFVLSQNDNIDDYEKLSGHRVAVQEGDVAISNLKTLPKVNIVYTKDQEEAFKKLLNGEVDAYIGNSLTGVNYINKLNARNKIKIVDTPLNPTDYAIAVRKGDRKTLNLINKALKEIKDNGTYEITFRKWFGYDINYPKWYVQNVSKIALLIIVIFAIALLAFYEWNDLLKEEVQKQTHKIKETNIALLKKNQQINEEKEFREQILNKMFNGIITINRDGIISFINTAALNMLNLNVDCVMGKNYKQTILKDIFFLDSMEKKNVENEVNISGNKMYINYKINLLNNNDKYNWETIISFRDITEEKLAQEAIRTKDKMQSLGTLLSGIAHEIRNPLTSIKTYAELIPKKYDNPKFREMISIDIPKEIERLNSLINDLLEYSRPRKPFKENINLLESLNEILLLIKDKALKNNVDIKINVGKDIHIFMDKNHLKQVMINLILNSIESMDKKYKVINIYTKIEGKKIVLYVEDNGCGIDEKDMDKIYNPFYTTKANGTGLGLFVIYQLLLENQVSISLQSYKNQGTKFLLEFQNN